MTEEETLMLMQRWSVSDSLPGQTLAAANRGGKAPGVGEGQRTGESRCKQPGRDSRNADRTWTLALTGLLRLLAVIAPPADESACGSEGKHVGPQTGCTLPPLLLSHSAPHVSHRQHQQPSLTRYFQLACFQVARETFPI